MVIAALSIGAWTLIVAAATLAAAIATLVLMARDRRARLHLTVAVEKPDPQVEFCLVWSVFNPGAKSVHVGQPGLLLKDGRRLFEQNDWSPPQVGLQLGVNYSYVRIGAFDLGAGQRDRVCRFVRNVIEHLETESPMDGVVHVRPFINYGEKSARYADTWWRVDLKAGQAQPERSGFVRRLVAHVKRLFQ